jgi:hypothetical protein
MPHPNLSCAPITMTTAECSPLGETHRLSPDLDLSIVTKPPEFTQFRQGVGECPHRPPAVPDLERPSGFWIDKG